ncbi:MAG: hypothetical protein M1821_001991 [Bathelium mastoideum]|nr:MAG: hypothetical protein M1821_001991 [Bathelium mastoideum]
MLHGLGGRAAELKQQAAIQAAQDPNSKVQAEDAEKTLLDEAHKSGSAAYHFDPNATAEEKAAAAKAHIPPGLHHERKPKVSAIVSDVDDPSAPKYDMPSPSKEGALPPPASASTVDGKAPHGHIEEDERWARDRVGWQPRFGHPDEEDETNMLEHETWLEDKLQDKFYGDWYHNAAIIVFSCLASWVVAILGGGLGWLTIVIAFCATYYRTSIRRIRRNFRDDIKREMAKTKLETDHESLEWINSFLVKFWPIYAPVLCDTIIASVDQVLSTATPAFLDSLRLKTFVLGTKPPRLEHVKTYPKAEDDTVLMDWQFSFTPNDVADLTSRQIKNKINPKVVLEVRIGKGMVSKGLDVIVEDMACTGLMRVKVKLQIPFPHIEKVEICFLGRPTLDYVCKPLGGDTFGFDINFIPGLETFIMEQIHANLGPMMYEPNVFPIEIAKMLAGNPIDEAIGVLQVNFHGAQGLKNPDKFSGTPDPYAIISVNQRTELGRTKTVHQSANPRWNETVNVIITNLKDHLTLQVFDFNEYRKDKELGVATFQLEQLESGRTEFNNEQLEVMVNGRARGVVQVDFKFFPVLEGEKLEDGTQAPPPETNTGVAKFTVEQVKDLDGTKSLIGQLSPYAVLLLNNREIHISKKLKRTNNPIFPDASKEMLITDRKHARLGLVLKDDRDMSTDPEVGKYQIKLDDMLEMMAKGQEWYNLMGTKTGRVKMMCTWKPVAISGVMSASGGYVKPIGVMRLHFANARELRNLEKMGKSDPYVRVLLSGIEKGRTVTFQNNLNPDWDEVVYVPVHTAREKLILEVMDQENFQKDRSLGLVELPLAEFIHQDESTGEYQTVEQKQSRSEQLKMRGQSKGFLNYSASFYPTFNVVDPEEEEEEEKVKQSMEEARYSLESSHKPKNSIDSTTSTAPVTPTHASKKSTDSATTPASASRSAALAERQRSGTISSLRSDATHQRTESQQAINGVPGKKEPPKITVTPDDLPKYGKAPSPDVFQRLLTKRLESGLIVFKLIDAELAYVDCYVEVVMDDMLFPSYVSPKVKTRNVTLNEIGDAMVREMEFSKITLRITAESDQKGEGKESRVKAKLVGNTVDTLRRCLYHPTQLTLKDKEGRESRVTVMLKYIPIHMQLDASESINNQGNLRVDVLDAADLPAADRNGKSDPYCKFMLNGKEIFRTQVQEKNLHPAWNEFFETSIRSRTAANFSVDIYDWDRAASDDFLGRAAINLDVLEPFVSQEVTLHLDGKSGAVRMKMLFKPDYVTRSRQGSHTFSGTFAQPGKVVGAPVKGVGKGAAFIGGGVMRVGKGATGVFRRKTRGESDVTESPSTSIPFQPSEQIPNGISHPDSPSPNATPVPALTTTSPDRTTSHDLVRPPHTPDRHGRTRSWGASSNIGTSPAADTGTATITLLSATGFPAGSTVQLRLKLESSASPGGRPGTNSAREIHKTKPVKAADGTAQLDAAAETATVRCTADARFRVIALGHHRLSSDEELGDAVFFVADQGSAATERSVPLSAEGRSVVLRSSFTPGPAATTGTDKDGLPTNGGRAERASSSGADRRSLVGGTPPRKEGLMGRFGTKREKEGRASREVTPGA